jgi:uncharacterized protein
MMPKENPHSDCCTGELHPQALVGIEHFNAHHFFEAHEFLEAAWREEPGPIRDLYHGIIQVAVAYYHIQRGNRRGALKMFSRCRRWLEKYPDQCRGIPVAQLRHDYQQIETIVKNIAPDASLELPDYLYQPIILIP